MSAVADRVHGFFHRREPAASVNLHSAAHACEDLPEDVREEGKKVLSTPTGTQFQRRAFDVLENAVLDAYGHAETEDCLRFLSRYPVKTYTYAVSQSLSRGERPSPVKLLDLAEQGFGATINLCKEARDGDAPDIARAGLPQVRTFHIPIVDMNPPTTDQAVDLLNLLSDLENDGVRTYLHCEAGKARTGVMTACYRMAIMGWSEEDALTEAKNFGCSVPMQQHFIEEFAAELANGIPVSATTPRKFPLRPLGSVKATPEELSVTLEAVAGAASGTA